MVKVLEGLLGVMSADMATTIIILTILAIFIAATLLYLKGKCEHFTNYAPVLLTSTGIFGTFFGISIGLVDFDTNNIEASIPSLLSGMKTAFFTSLAGMFFSIIFKLVQSKTRIHNDPDTPQEFDIVDIVHAMHKQQDSFNALIAALGGDNDTSILSQMKLLRADINDNTKIALKVHQESSAHIQNINTLLATQKEGFREFSDKLWIKLQDFADILSKSATETIIEALRQVIVDFNSNLTEQFGENFKELNNAVSDLVKWQENYKNQMEQMTEQYKLGVTVITATEVAVGHISANTQAIPPAMDELTSIMSSVNDVMQVNQQQLNELGRHLLAFVEMKDKAVAAVPIINEQVNNTIKAISASVESATVHYNNLHKSTGMLQENVVENIKNMQTRLEATLKEIFDANSQNMEKTFAKIESGLQTQAEKTRETVQSQLDLIDQSMQKELERVMQTMGRALGQISNQFVSDYRHLVEQMDKIVSNRN